MKTEDAGEYIKTGTTRCCFCGREGDLWLDRRSGNSHAWPKGWGYNYGMFSLGKGNGEGCMCPTCWESKQLDIDPEVLEYFRNSTQYLKTHKDWSWEETKCSDCCRPFLAMYYYRDSSRNSTICWLCRRPNQLELIDTAQGSQGFQQGVLFE